MLMVTAAVEVLVFISLTGDCTGWLYRGGRFQEQQVGLAPYEFGAAEVKRHETNNLPPFWANRGRRDEEFGPFWANRGKRTDGLAPSDGWQVGGRRLLGDKVQNVCCAAEEHARS